MHADDRADNRLLRALRAVSEHVMALLAGRHTAPRCPNLSSSSLDPVKEFSDVQKMRI
ncbi:hypothetical protein ABH917_001103 [Thermobifida halotolerans]